MINNLKMTGNFKPQRHLRSKFWVKKRNDEEFQEQKAFVTWLNLNKIEYFAIPNGGSRNLIEASKLKQSGVKAGVCDLFIMEPNRYHYGLFIEMKKRKGGVVTQYQKLFIEKAIDKGYCAVVCNGCYEAINVVQKYIKQVRR